MNVNRLRMPDPVNPCRSRNPVKIIGGENLEAVLFYFTIQRPFADAEHFGRFFAVSAGDLERLADEQRLRARRGFCPPSRAGRLAPRPLTSLSPPAAARARRAGRRGRARRRSRRPPCSRSRCGAAGRCRASRRPRAAAGPPSRCPESFCCAACVCSLRKWSIKQRNVLAPLGKPRQRDRHHLQPVIQVLAERAGAIASSRSRLVADRMRTFDVDRLVGPDAGDLAALEHAQQLDLRRQRHVAHFVEKQRAAVGVLEFAQPVGARRR